MKFRVNFLEDVLLLMPSLSFHTFIRLSFAINVSLSVSDFNLSISSFSERGDQLQNRDVIFFSRIFGPVFS